MAEKNDLKEVKKPQKEKSGKRRFRFVRETWSELKKVTWPSFGTIARSTGVVLLVVAIFLVILLAFDLILRFFVFNPLISGGIGGVSPTTTESFVDFIKMAASAVSGRLL